MNILVLMSHMKNAVADWGDGSVKVPSLVYCFILTGYSLHLVFYSSIENGAGTIEDKGKMRTL